MNSKRWLAAILSAGVVAAGLPAYGARAAEAYAGGTAEGNMEAIVATKYEENSYRYVRQGTTQTPAARRASAGAQALDAASSRGARVEWDETARADTVVLAAGAQAVFLLQVPADGLYTIEIAYLYEELDNVKNSDLTILVDGALPFAESGRLVLPRFWTQEPVEHRAGGNDFTPKSVQTRMVGRYTARDDTGMEGRYLYPLTKGAHAIALQSTMGGFRVAGVTLGEGALPDDESYRKSWTLPFSGKTYTVEAEELAYKNDSSITSGVDRTSASVSPNDPVYKRVNVLGGSKFLKPYQLAAWKLKVEKAGRYRVGVKFKQDTLQGLFVTRRLLLDGEPVCEGLSNLRFAYDGDWQYAVLGSSGGELCLELSAGEHTLALEVTLGDMAEYARRMDEAVYALNYLYRKIIMVTGTTPDPMRDYNLASEIPYLVPGFTEVREELTAIYGELEAMGVKGGQVSILSQLAAQLRTFIDDPYTIQNRLASYKSNIAALSTFVMAVQEQPLTIDYLSLIGTRTGDTGTADTWYGSLWFGLRSFIGSFFTDYTSLAGGGQPGASSLKVWFSGGREQAEMLKGLVDSDFTPAAGVPVNLQLVQISLNQAILAGTAPDVMLTTVRSQPVNLGARGVLEDLAAYPGFEEQRAVYGDNLLRPYTHAGHVYALPVTLDYHVMFYRKDILTELGLKPPETWEEFYGCIPILQRSNMAIGLPYTMLSTQNIIESGIGAKDLFATLVSQRGASLYTEDGAAITLDTPEVVAAFEQWTAFYTQYQLDLEYNFYNRFRTGEMPIGIQSYSGYNMLEAAAPEIRGQWAMTTVPGTRAADGSVNRSEAASGNGAVILKAAKDKEAAWAFLNWWVSAETQGAYGNELEILMGKASRYNPANPGAMKLLPWRAEELAVLEEQRAYVKELPEVLGGYYTVRGLDNAFRNVVFSGRNYKEALSEQEIIINVELTRKQKEFSQLAR